MTRPAASAAQDSGIALHSEQDGSDGFRYVAFTEQDISPLNFLPQPNVKASTNALSSVDIVPLGFQSNADSPIHAEEVYYPDINVVVSPQQQVLLIPGHSREVVVRTRMATYPGVAIDSDHPPSSSFSLEQVEIITKSPNEEEKEGDQVLFFAAGRPIVAPASNDSIHTQVPAKTSLETSSPTAQRSKLAKIPIKEQLDPVKELSSKKEDVQEQLDQVRELSSKKEDVKEQLDQVKEQKDQVRELLPKKKDIKEQKDQVRELLPKKEDVQEQLHQVKGSSSKKHIESVDESHDNEKDLQLTESVAKPFRKFQKTSPIGLAYTVTQGHSKVKFFGFNSLHGPDGNAGENASNAFHIDGAQRIRTLPAIKKSVAIKLKRKTVRPVYFTNKPLMMATE